ncbi:hypothetical protein L7F22_007799 [Adiantum nelumboides]|nr:hypothetical protein [Adiantum nelumboides]
MWNFIGTAAMKCFLWKVLWGALPTSNKIHGRGIGTDRCSGCRMEIENPLHLFTKCQLIVGLAGKLKKWVKSFFRVPCSKLDLVVGPGSQLNEALLASAQVVRYTFLKQIWQARNSRVFEHKPTSVQFEQITDEVVQTIITLGANQKSEEWREVVARASQLKVDNCIDNPR